MILADIQAAVNPQSCTRPRFSRATGRAYHTKQYHEYRKALEAVLVEKWDGPPIDRPVCVSIICLAARPKTTKLPFPKPDVDNYAKGVLDALQGAGVLKDDWLVKYCDTQKAWAQPGDPGRIHIIIEEAPDN